MKTIYKTKDICIQKDGEIVKKFYISSGSKKEFTNSFELMNLIKNNPHPNITPILNINEKEFYIEYPFYKFGDIYHEINRVGIEKLETNKICHHLVKAIKHMHSLGVAHTDIKPDNIFISNDKNYLLGDIEISRGTKEYLSPERYKSKTIQGSRKDDIWALGILIFNLNCYSFPFSFPSTKCSIYRKFLMNQKSIFRYIPKYPKNKTKKLILKLLQKNPEERELIENIEEFYESIMS